MRRRTLLFKIRRRKKRWREASARQKERERSSKSLMILILSSHLLSSHLQAAKAKAKAKAEVRETLAPWFLFFSFFIILFLPSFRCSSLILTRSSGRGRTNILPTLTLVLPTFLKKGFLFLVWLSWIYVREIFGCPKIFLSLAIGFDIFFFSLR